MYNMASATIKRRKLDLNAKEGWSAVAFLALAQLAVTWSLGEAGSGEGLTSLVFVILGAIAASFFLTKGHLPWSLAHLSSLIWLRLERHSHRLPLAGLIHFS